MKTALILLGCVILFGTIGSLTRAQQINQECTAYAYGCPQLPCTKVSGECTVGGSTYWFDYLYQDSIVLGDCVPGSGTCSTSTLVWCTSWKYQSSFWFIRCRYLACTDTTSGTGCQ